MRKQIEAANRLKLRAETINSTNSDDWQAVRQRLLNDEIDLLLISPERLANDEFVTHTLLPIAARIGLLVIDEAHCISDWGHGEPFTQSGARFRSPFPIISTGFGARIYVHL